MSSIWPPAWIKLLDYIGRVGKLVNVKLRYLRHLSHAYILLIMGLFEVLIANMMVICGANNIKINIT